MKCGGSVSGLCTSACTATEVLIFHSTTYNSTTRKQDNIHLLACETREHLERNYFNSLKVFTDGSLCESGDAGAGFVIPALNINKSFYLGKNYSIFTAELIAILMALNTLVAIPRQFF